MNKYLEKISNLIRVLDSDTFKQRIQTSPDNPVNKVVEKEREPGCGMTMRNPINQNTKVAEMIKVVEEKKKITPGAIVDAGRHINGDNPP